MSNRNVTTTNSNPLHTISNIPKPTTHRADIPSQPIIPHISSHHNKHNETHTIHSRHKATTNLTKFNNLKQLTSYENKKNDLCITKQIGISIHNITKLNDLIPEFTFKKKEKVLVKPTLFFNDILEAKILDRKLDEFNQPQYKIHYKGKNKRHDQWIDLQRLLKKNETSLQKQQQRRQERQQYHKNIECRGKSKGVNINNVNNDKRRLNVELPSDADPITFYDEHDTINVHWPAKLKKLRAARGKSFYKKKKTKFSGIFKLANYLWITVPGIGICEKIEAVTMEEWMVWIPKQHQVYIEKWIAFCYNNDTMSVWREEKFKERFVAFYNAVINLYVKINKDPIKCELYKIEDIGHGKKRRLDDIEQPPSKRQKLNHNMERREEEKKVNQVLNDDMDDSQIKMEKQTEKALDSDGMTHCANCKAGMMGNELWRCSNCKLSYYCNEQCQLQHWEIHKIECNISKQVKMENTEIEDDINDNQIKLEKEMDAEQLDIDEIRREMMGMINCANCKADMKDKEAWKCSNCKVLYYCNKQCQLQHWETHKMECSVSKDVKMERVDVKNWNCCGIIYWLNRVNDGIFSGVEYMLLRRHIVMGQLKGCDLLSINVVTLRMMGIHKDKQEMILNALTDVVMNNNFDNKVANGIKTDNIPIEYFDAMSHEIMTDPVKIRSSEYIYDREYITKYIQLYGMDPITKQKACLQDIILCQELKSEIDIWKKANFSDY